MTALCSACTPSPLSTRNLDLAFQLQDEVNSCLSTGAIKLGADHLRSAVIQQVSTSVLLDYLATTMNHLAIRNGMQDRTQNETLNTPSSHSLLSRQERAEMTISAVACHTGVARVWEHSKDRIRCDGRQPTAGTPVQVCFFLTGTHATWRCAGMCGISTGTHAAWRCGVLCRTRCRPKICGCSSWLANLSIHATCSCCEGLHCIS